MAGSRTAERSLQQRCEDVGDAARIDVAGFSVSDEVADGADAIAGDDWAAAEHGFVDDEAEGFVTRGNDHEVGGFVELGGVAIDFDEAEELNFVGDFALRGFVFTQEFGALRAIAGKN